MARIGASIGLGKIGTVGGLTATNAAGPLVRDVAATSTVPTLIPNKASTTSGIGAQASGNVSIIAGGTEIARVTSTEVTLIGGAILRIGGTSGPVWRAGAGSPEGASSAPVGSIFSDTTNGELYIKNTGTGNTGWKLVTRAA